MSTNVTLINCEEGRGVGPRGDDECPLCRESFVNDQLTITHTANGCNKTFCADCLRSWVDYNTGIRKSSSCPNCRIAIFVPTDRSGEDLSTALAFQLTDGSTFEDGGLWPLTDTEGWSVENLQRHLREQHVQTSDRYQPLLRGRILIHELGMTQCPFGFTLTRRAAECFAYSFHRLSREFNDLLGSLPVFTTTRLGMVAYIVRRAHLSYHEEAMEVF